MATTYEVKTIFKLIDQFTHPLRAVEKEGRGMADLLKNQYASAERTINAIPGKLLNIGKVAVGVGVGAIAAGIGVATKEYIAFDKNMQQAAATFGDMDITAAGFKDQLDLISEGTQKVARLTQFNSEQASRAMFTMAQAGLSSVSALEVLPKAADTATVAGLSLDDAFGKVASTISNMQMAVTGANFETVSDIMNKMSTSEYMSFDEATAAMANAAGKFATLGLPVQSLGAAVQVLAEEGVRGAQAGTYLDAAMRQITAPAKLKQLEAMGVVVSDSFDNMLPLADIIDRLNEKLDGMGNVNRQGILTSIFASQGSEAMSRLLAAGGDRIREVEKTLYDSGGTTKQMADVMNQSLSAQIGFLKSALSGLGQSFVSTFKVDGMSVIQKLTDVVNNFTENVLPRIISVINAMIPALKTVAGIFMNIAQAIWALRGPIMVALGLFAAFKGVMMAVVIVSNIFAVVSKIAAAAQWILNASLFGCPLVWIIGLIILAIGAIIGIVAAIKNWGAITEWLSGVWAKVVEFFSTAWEAVSGFFAKIWEGITGFFGSVWEGVLGIVDKVKTALQPLFDFFMGIFNSIMSAWQGLVQAFQTGGLVGALKHLGGAILSFLLAPIEKLLGALTWVPGIGGKISEWRDSLASFRAGLTGADTETTDVAPITARDAQSIQTERFISETENNSNVTIGLERGLTAQVSGSAPGIRVEQYHSGGF